MQNFAAAVIVFTGGFIIMVLEIVGTRYLAKDFGSSFYVWVNQIGLVMLALALGYYLGGQLADRWRRLGRLAWLLAPAGVFIIFIPNFSDDVLKWIVSPVELTELTPFRRTIEPILGSAVIFLFPCVLLAMLSPYLTQLSVHNLARVGRASGLIFAASTVGSIAGVFVSGYYLINTMGLTMIFRVTGVATLLLAAMCLALDRQFSPNPEPKS